jgi:CheY-like chemotaxis protein
MLQPALHGVRVLCIDNEEEILRGMESLLGQWGCHVLSARGPGELSPLLGELPPAILLVDYHLDENLTGIELVRQLPASWQAAPCIIISADDSDDLKHRAALADYTLIAKPVSADQLAALMTSLLEQSGLD